ncbi:class I SAM-dependent methyltransferase, partial [bacterium]
MLMTCEMNKNHFMNNERTFAPVYFEKLKKAEDRHFWFKVRRKWIYDRVKKFILPPASVLEIGCGTGNVSSFLSQKEYSVIGCEYFAEAIGMSWPGFIKVQGDSNTLPFKDNSVDIIGLFDVLEHFENDIAPLKEAYRVLREGGIIVLTVPAEESLWNWEDEVSFHKRRYSKERCKKILGEAELDPLKIQYMFMSLYLPMKYLRAKGKMRDNPFKINKDVNTILT